MEALLRGAVIGLFVAAPPGPNAALCMSRTLVGGRRAGTRSGLGSASAHALYAALAVGGLGRGSGFLTLASSPIRLAGGLVLIVLGLRLGLSPSPASARPASSAYGMTLALGLANPFTLLYFAAAVGAGAIPSGAGPTVVAGVFAGSTLWWIALASAVAALREHVDARRLVWVSRVTAAAVTAFGVVAVATAL